MKVPFQKELEPICMGLTYFLFYLLTFLTLWKRLRVNRHKRHILIFSHDLLGDGLSRIPFFAALRKEMPKDICHISIFVRESLVEIYRAMPYFDEVISAKTGFDRHPIIWMLRGDMWWAINRPADVTINFLRDISSWQEFINSLIRAKLRIGPHKGISQNTIITTPHYRQFAIPQTPQNNIKKFNDILKFMIPSPQGVRCLLPSELTFLAKPIDRLNLKRPFIAVVPGASEAYRRWPSDRFADVLKVISEKYPQFSFVILGVDREHTLGETICSALPEKAINLCGKTSFFELGEILKEAKAVLTNETGTATFAAILDTPTVCILGGGEFGTFFPNSEFYHNTISIYKKEPCFGCAWNNPRCKLEGIAPCIDSISVNLVLKELYKCLRSSAE